MRLVGSCVSTWLWLWLWLRLVIAWGVSVPGPAGFGDEVGGGLLVVAEGPSDHGCGGSEEQLADR